MGMLGGRRGSHPKRCFLGLMCIITMPGVPSQGFVTMWPQLHKTYSVKSSTTSVLPLNVCVVFAVSLSACACRKQGRPNSKQYLFIKYVLAGKLGFLLIDLQPGSLKGK